MAKVNTQIKAVLFDMDGLLLDTEPLYKEAAQRVCDKYGKIYTEDVRKRVVGCAEVLGAQTIVDDLGLPLTAHEFLDLRTVELETLLPECKPMPGAVKLTQHLKAKGVPIAVATSSVQHAVTLKLRNHKEWFSIFNVIVSGDNPKVKQGKPAPDIFLAAASEVNIRPADCLVFEDAPSGVRAGKAANMTVVAVPGLDDMSLYTPADVILQSLELFVPANFGLPAYE